jgi:hypothetical protein
LLAQRTKKFVCALISFLSVVADLLFQAMQALIGSKRNNNCFLTRVRADM